MTEMGAAPVAVSGRRSRPAVRRQFRAWHLYLFIAPTFALVLVFQYYPALSAVFHAFTDWNGAGSWNWTGLANFQAMAQDFALTISVRNLALLLTWQVVRALTIPLLFAELIFNFPNARAQYWFRLLLITPLVIPVVVESLVWRFILGPAPLGVLNAFLGLIGLAQFQHAWLAEPQLALYGLMFSGFPWVLPVAMLIYYAGLQAIPDGVLDATRIDGATTLRRVFRVDIPLIAGQLKLIFILNVIGGMQDFAWIFIMTNGGPGYATTVPALYMYEQAFSSGQFGYGSAIGLLLFIVIFALTLANYRFIRSGAAYDA